MIDRRTLAAGLLVLAAVPVAAQPVPPALAPEPQPVAAPVAPLPRVRLDTSAGAIVIALDTVRAPLTAGNFLRYVVQKRLDGTSFYRALSFPAAPGFGLVQGGVRGEPKRSLKPIPHEPTSRTGILHGDGTVSMARLAPGTAAGDFFITLGAIPSLDAQASGTGDIQGFAAFGQVVEGMDVVRRIQAAPISATAGEGAMKGQMLAAPVRIVSARRVD